MGIRPGTAMLLIATTLTSMPVCAQDENRVHPWLEDDFVISLGGFFPRKEFKIGVDGQAPGLEIDLTQDAGLSESQSTASLTSRWKFGDNWSVTGQFWSTDNRGDAVLSEDVFWGDNVLRAGSNVAAGADLDLARVFFGREFFTREAQHEFGLGAGFHWLRIGAFIEGEMFVNDQSRGFQRESVSADVPLPNIGAWYWRSLSPRWLLTTHADWFSASIGDYSGSLWNLGAGIQFQAWKHVGFGLSYQYFKIDIDVDQSDWHGNVQLTQDGPFLSLNVNW
jgi:hypothetical protein